MFLGEQDWLFGIDGVNAQEVLEKGLNDLMELCDVVIEKFEAAQEEFENRMAEWFEQNTQHYFRRQGVRTSIASLCTANDLNYKWWIVNLIVKVCLISISSLHTC